MQAQKTVQFVQVRFIALAFGLLAALLLASAAGYVLRGGGASANPPVALPTLHFTQQTDNMMEREHDRLSPILTSPYGVGH
ncbi:MAG: hypothetical protein E6J18_06755 [Chloroflexi bacterium]|nr:MAG: hypothetical protein E6J18_06755 [Chloroflexota bacterium]